MTTRAVVLARGLGTRMKTADAGAVLTPEQARAADAGLKAMMPVGGRPFLDYLLGAVADAGLRAVALVVAPQHDALRRHYEELAPPARMTIDFVVQPTPEGTADALQHAEAWTDGDAFLVLNGDNLYPAPVLQQLAEFGEPGLAAFDPADLSRSGNIDPARLRAFAVVEVDAGGYLRRIVEKPSAGEAERAGSGPRVSLNCWRFDHRIFAACRAAPRSPRGERELPTAVMLALDRGVRFRALDARGPVLDLSHRADARRVAAHLAGVTPRP